VLIDGRGTEGFLFLMMFRCLEKCRFIEAPEAVFRFKREQGRGKVSVTYFS